MKHLAIGFALLLLATAAARGTEPLPRYGNDCAYCVPMEVDRLAALLGDHILRDLVCRLSHERYSFGSLSSALGMAEGQVMRRINTLRGWRLVRTVGNDSAHTIVEPIPGEGAQTLRRWASRYCPTGDECGRAVASQDGQNDRRAISGMGTASFGSGEARLIPTAPEFDSRKGLHARFSVIQGCWQQGSVFNANDSFAKRL